MEPGIAIPILPARDLAETRAFYERLGFRATGWWPEAFGGYAILARGDLEVHFFAWRDVPLAENYAGCYWRVSDADRLHADAAASGLPPSGIPRVTAIEDKPWGMREFAVVDPNGNLVRIGQRLG